jgi:hypothetical protein
LSPRLARLFDLYVSSPRGFEGWLRSCSKSVQMSNRDRIGACLESRLAAKPLLRIRVEHGGNPAGIEALPSPMFLYKLELASRRVVMV